jgi:hypothetical protein
MIAREGKTSYTCHSAVQYSANEKMLKLNVVSFRLFI